MAHNLMKTEQGYAYAGANELAWHRLGVTTDHVMTSKEAIKLAQLDYEVGINPLYTTINDTEIIVPTHSVTYNKQNGNIFGVVGQRYEVIQNLEAFNFLDGIVGEGEAAFHTAGALGMGETIFITVKLPQNVRIKSLPDEQIENYLLFTSSHDGSGAIKVLFTPIRVVCNNTLTAALTSSTSQWSIKHTKNARNRLSDIQKLFVIIKDEIDHLGKMFNVMHKAYLSDFAIDTLITKAVLNNDEYLMDKDDVLQLKSNVSSRKQNIIYQIKKNIYTGIGQDIINPNTAYGVYNGVTTYLQNAKKYKSDEDKFKALYSKKNIGNKVMDELNLVIDEN